MFLTFNSIQGNNVAALLFGFVITVITPSVGNCHGKINAVCIFMFDRLFSLRMKD